MYGRKVLTLPPIFSQVGYLCCEFACLFYSCFFLVPVFGKQACHRCADKPDVAPAVESAACAELYRSMQLEGVVSWNAFRQAVTGYHKIAGRKRDVLTLIDFSRPSTEQRLFVFDMGRRKLLFSSVVAHGKNSGDKYATSFSNEYGSYKSSLGFYLTETTYQGRNGYSLILNGLEKGINDRARERAIVMHGAAYADPSVASRGGRLGRSFGCPAVPQKLSRPIIDAIKGGSVMYIYAGTPDYLAHSSVLKKNDRLVSGCFLSE